MPEDRKIVISRRYEKAGEKTRILYVSQISGDNIAGMVYRFEVWAVDQELKNMRVESGNAYEVRRAFLKTLLDMNEDGWGRKGSTTTAHPEERFFDPQYL